MATASTISPHHGENAPGTSTPPTLNQDQDPSTGVLTRRVTFSSLTQRFRSTGRTSTSRSSRSSASNGSTVFDQVGTIATATTTIDDSAATKIPFPLSPPSDSSSADSAPVPDLSSLPSLPKPIAIPRLAVGSDMPFARAWSSSLSPLSISQADFLAFLDVLNIMTSPHPTVTVLRLVALGASFIPLDYADAIEAAVQITAEGVQLAIIKKRVGGFLRAANETYWHPRGCHVRIMGTKKLKKKLGVQKGDKMIVKLTEDIIDLTTLERLVRGMEQWCSPLVVDAESLPPSVVGSKSRSLLERAAQWRVSRTVKKQNKEAQRRRKRQIKRKEKGKKIKGDTGEQTRLRWLDWLVIEKLDEYEKEKEEKKRLKEEKKELGLVRRMMSWRTVGSERGTERDGVEESVLPQGDSELGRDPIISDDGGTHRREYDAVIR